MHGLPWSWAKVVAVMNGIILSFSTKKKADRVIKCCMKPSLTKIIRCTESQTIKALPTFSGGSLMSPARQSRLLCSVTRPGFDSISPQASRRTLTSHRASSCTMAASLLTSTIRWSFCLRQDMLMSPSSKGLVVTRYQFHNQHSPLQPARFWWCWGWSSILGGDTWSGASSKSPNRSPLL